MLNSMIVALEKNGSQYDITVQVPENEYFCIYDDLDKEAASDIIKQYMTYQGDDARYSDVAIDHNSNTHIVTIRAHLHYLDNDHTEQFVIPPHLADRI